jgi:hypothetical protein
VDLGGAGIVVAAEDLRDRAYIARVAVALAAEQVPDGAGRQRGFGQEPDRRARRDQIRIVLLGVS